jgi:hypothetical protein
MITESYSHPVHGLIRLLSFTRLTNDGVGERFSVSWPDKDGDRLATYFETEEKARQFYEDFIHDRLEWRKLDE